MFGDKFINTTGSAQFLNATPGVTGLSLFDDRNDEGTLALLRTFADSVTIVEKQRLDCDTGASGDFADIYPCPGARLTALTKNIFFQWNLGSNLRAQVQISTDPAFATISLTSASDRQFLPKDRVYWLAGARKWKKIKKLGSSGAPVYWRVLATDGEGNETSTQPFVFYLP